MSEIAELVSLVSFLVANEGITLVEAAKATHRTPRRLLNDLDRMVMCGVPPYTPSDYINYSLRGHGDQARIKINFAGHFARPLNFTPQEALALKYALEHFSRGADPESLKQAEDMSRLLREALHGRARELLADGGKGFVTPRRTERMRRMIGLLSKAVEDRRVLELEYYSAHRARLASRMVHPFAVLEIGAHFYLYAWCALAADTRHFRLDRIRDARLQEQRFEASAPRKREAGRMDSLFHGTPKDKLVVRFSREVAREVLDEWDGSPDVQIRQLRDGRAELETPLYNQFWAVGFLMGFGEHAELLKPRWLRAELLQTVQQSLKAHE